MVDIEEINRIFDQITEYYDEPVRIGSRCESSVYYRVEDITDSELNLCAQYVAERTLEVCYPDFPELILKLPGGYSFFAERLAVVFSELSPGGKDIP
ncbi:MAG: hypothetical protein D6808_01320, partial [Candidatus Dadabacteria bacterium]